MINFQPAVTKVNGGSSYYRPDKVTYRYKVTLADYVESTIEITNDSFAMYRICSSNGTGATASLGYNFGNPTLDKTMGEVEIEFCAYVYYDFPRTPDMGAGEWPDADPATSWPVKFMMKKLSDGSVFKSWTALFSVAFSNHLDPIPALPSNLVLWSETAGAGDFMSDTGYVMSNVVQYQSGTENYRSYLWAPARNFAGGDPWVENPDMDDTANLWAQYNDSISSFEYYYGRKRTISTGLIPLPDKLEDLMYFQDDQNSPNYIVFDVSFDYTLVNAHRTITVDSAVEDEFDHDPATFTTTLWPRYEICGWTNFTDAAATPNYGTYILATSIDTGYGMYFTGPSSVQFDTFGSTPDGQGDFLQSSVLPIDSAPFWYGDEYGIGSGGTESGEPPFLVNLPVKGGYPLYGNYHASVAGYGLTPNVIGLTVPFREQIAFPIDAINGMELSSEEEASFRQISRVALSLSTPDTTTIFWTNTSAGITTIKDSYTHSIGNISFKVSVARGSYYDQGAGSGWVVGRVR